MLIIIIVHVPNRILSNAKLHFGEDQSTRGRMQRVIIEIDVNWDGFLKIDDDLGGSLRDDDLGGSLRADLENHRL